MKAIFLAIRQLADYGISTGLIEPEDKIFVINQLLELLHLDAYEAPADETSLPALPEILEPLVQYAVEQELTINDGITARDLFDTRLMAVLTPRPSQVIRTFRELYADSPEKATDYYYKLSGDTNYIRRDRVSKDLKWLSDTEYGQLDITINLSKPEKDPKAIAAALTQKQTSYPLCALCKENEGYAGRLNHPARQNHRIIPMELTGDSYYLQYSPYVYYNEHCIVFNAEHTPMKIDRNAFAHLLAFVEQFPHYFLGSNADLPIVGGSILTHDHFQGGHYEFAMAKSPVETEVTFKGYEDISAGIVKWPMSVLRLRGKDAQRITDLSDKILTAWRAYSDPDCEIYAFSGETPHNTITPIARMRDGEFEMDLVLRNNRTTEQYPLGMFHPHPEHHHIKKENIGLIEVMGLAVLPARLKNEMVGMKQYLLSGEEIPADSSVAAHGPWIRALREKYGDAINESSADEIIRKEIGLVYAEILEQAGVYKRDEAGKKGFLRFVDAVNG